MKCLVENCGIEARRRGYCGKHYHKVLRWGNAEKPNPVITSICTIQGCDNRHNANGFCHKHYNRWKRHGDPLFTKHAVVFGTVSERFWAKVDKSKECWEWTARRTRQGYGQFVIDRGGAKWRTEMAHRVSWELAHGKIPNGMLVCHKCDNPPCVNPDHLFLGSTKENARDRENKGRGVDLSTVRHARGEETNNAKLTDKAVREIRERYKAGGVTQTQLAKEYGVNQTKISDVVNYRTWKHVE